MYSFTRRRLIVVLLLTSVLLLTLDRSESGLVGGVKDAFGVVFRPVERFANVVSRPLSNVWRGVLDYSDMRKENLALKDLLVKQEGAAIAATASVREAQELLALNGLPTLAGIDSVTAQVVGQSPSNFTQTFELNRGKSSGIRVGMTVTNGAGLVGKITGVTLERSVVMLATDPEYAMSVKVGACTRANTTTTSPPQTTTTLATDGSSTADTMAPGDGATAPVTTVALSTTTTTSTTSTTTTVLQRATTTTIKGFTPFATTLPPIPGGGGATQITVPESGVLLPRETGAMEGQGIDRLPVIRFIQSSSRLGELCAGVPVVTAGGSQSLAPADLVVGTVSRVVTRTGTSGPLLEVELAANLGSLNFVRVLLYQPATEIPQ
ncbi:MAG: rod shape-determining protein MreC [Actinobacteria bacterium]|nr:rod shape-determining protein MreC [Actinomycetota bacterium]